MGYRSPRVLTQLSFSVEKASEQKKEVTSSGILNIKTYLGTPDLKTPQNMLGVSKSIACNFALIGFIILICHT
jgi:hypothetical protein